MQRCPLSLAHRLYSFPKFPYILNPKPQTATRNSASQPHP